VRYPCRILILHLGRSGGERLGTASGGATSVNSNLPSTLAAGGFQLGTPMSGNMTRMLQACGLGSSHLAEESAGLRISQSLLRQNIFVAVAVECLVYAFSFETEIPRFRGRTLKNRQNCQDLRFMGKWLICVKKIESWFRHVISDFS